MTLTTLNNVIKKNQPKKIVLKKVNFGSTNWLNQKRSLGTQQHVKIFSYLNDILLFYFRVMLCPQHFTTNSRWQIVIGFKLGQPL